MYCKDCRWNSECEFWELYKGLETYLSNSEWKAFEAVRVTFTCDEEEVVTRDPGE